MNTLKHLGFMYLLTLISLVGIVYLSSFAFVTYVGCLLEGISPHKYHPAIDRLLDPIDEFLDSIEFDK